jgi:hypothetical protein
MQVINNLLNWKTVISMIIANTSLSGILKTFKVTIHHPKTPVIKEIIWESPLHNWTKCNFYGACTGNSGNASCSGIFRNHDAEFMFCFVEPLRNSSQYQAKLCRTLRAIELAYQMNWKNL